jgi:sugar O-acyltransferase (sialic acid O-acetyltransferase NeuD family)
MDRKIILVGGFHQIIELCEDENIDIIGIIDNNIHSKSFMGYMVLGGDDDAYSLYNQYKDTPILVTPDNPLLKKKLVLFYESIGYKITNLISSKALISRYALIGDRGVIIYPNVRVSTNANINNYVRLHYNSFIGHDTVIDSFSNVAPCSVVLGRVTIGRNVYIGANSTILPGVKINDNAVVGAGTVVIGDIPKSEVWAGNPAKKIKDVDIQNINI